MSYRAGMTEEFKNWLENLSSEARDEMRAVIKLLKEKGWRLGAAVAPPVRCSRHSGMRELKAQTGIRHQLRGFFITEPIKDGNPVLLYGDVKGHGKKETADLMNRAVPIADTLADKFLENFWEERNNETD